MMIRLSTYSAIQVLSETVTKDLDAVPLHLYEFTGNGGIQSQFVQTDTQGINSREYAVGDYIGRIWLNPTPAFYPEKEISPTFHDDAKLQNLLNAETLPVMQYKNVDLMLGQGFGYDSNTRGMMIRVFVKLNNGRQTTLSSIYDLATHSNIAPATQTLYQSQIFNTKLSFQIPDIDYILNSTDADIITLKNRIFGSEVPTRIYFEYSELTQENIDTIIINEYDYVQFNVSNIASNSLDFSFQEAADIFGSLQLNPTNRAIISHLKNENYDVETYLNKYKTSEQSYTVMHEFQTNFYDVGSTLIGSKYSQVKNSSDKFASIEYIPLVTANTDHFETAVLIKVINDQTGLTFSKFASIIVSDAAIINNFLYSPSAIELNLSEDVVFNKLNQTINKIQMSADTPEVVTVTKPIYISIEAEAETLTLLPATFTAKIQPGVTTTDVSALYLKIDNLTIKNVDGDLTAFTVPAKAYNTASETYYLLNSANEVVNTGKLVKKV